MSIKIKRLLSVFMAIFAVGLFVTVSFAVYHILYSIDPETHFYYDNAKYVSATNILLTVFTVLLILPIFIRKKSAPRIAFKGRRPVFAVFALLLAICLFAESLYNISQTFRSASGAGAFLTGACGILAVIFFVILASSSFTGKSMDLRVLALLPVLWSIVNLVSTFMSLTQIANISEYLYEVLEMVFATLFFYYNARLVGSVPNGREVFGVFAFGLPCALFSLLSALPPFIAHLINANRGGLPNAQDAVFLATALYILSLLVSVLKDGRGQSNLPAREPSENIDAK